MRVSARQKAIVNRLLPLKWNQPEEKTMSCDMRINGAADVKVEKSPKRTLSIEERLSLLEAKQAQVDDTLTVLGVWEAAVAARKIRKEAAQVVEAEEKAAAKDRDDKKNGE